MKKKLLAGLAIGLLGLSLAGGEANATLTIIGKAAYGGSNYNLIYDDVSPFGPVTWLDYTKGYDIWQNQKDWASGLGASLTVSLLPGYTTTNNWTTDWRLPSTVDGAYVLGTYGTNGTTPAGWNITTSEMGHLHYTELGNKGFYDVNGNIQSGGIGLLNTGPFTNLAQSDYWSGTEYAADTNRAWYFYFNDGSQWTTPKGYNHYALAVHSGNVGAPVPEPATMFLLGTGLAGLVASRRRLRK